MQTQSEKMKPAEPKRDGETYGKPEWKPTDKAAAKPTAEKSAERNAKKAGPFKSLPSFLKDKKNRRLAAAVALIAVALILYFTTLDFGGSKKQTEATTVQTAEEYRDKAQRELEEFLARVRGAGLVKALINFESTPELIIAYITNSNKNSTVGADGKLNENVQASSNPVILNKNGTQSPLILKEIYPKVTGVVVAAEGAADTAVRLTLLDAVRTYFHIDSSIVQVFPLK